MQICQLKHPTSQTSLSSESSFPLGYSNWLTIQTKKGTTTTRQSKVGRTGGERQARFQWSPYKGKERACDGFYGEVERAEVARGKTAFDSKERRRVASPASQIRLIAAGLSIQDECAAREATDGASPFTRNDGSHEKRRAFVWASSPRLPQRSPLFLFLFLRDLAVAYGIPLQLDAPVSLRFSAAIFLSPATGRGSRSTIATRSIHNDPLLHLSSARGPGKTTRIRVNLFGFSRVRINELSLIATYNYRLSLVAVES